VRQSGLAGNAQPFIKVIMHRQPPKRWSNQIIQQVLVHGFNLKNSSKAGTDFTKLYFLISDVKLACLSQMEKNA